MKLLYFACIALFLASCGEREQQELPVSTGKLGSLIIVSDQETHQQLNETIESVFLRPIPYLPAGEPVFEYLKPNPYDFKKFFFNHRLILVIVNESNMGDFADILLPISEKTMKKNINDTSLVLMSKKDLFAKYQHVVYLFAKNNNDLKNKLINGQNTILKTLMQLELDDQQQKTVDLDKGSNRIYEKNIKDSLGLSIKIPDMFTLKAQKNNVFWFQFDALERVKDEGERQKNIGLILHTYNYTDTSDFLYPNIIAKRDTVTKYLIPGELPGTYMGTTESKWYPPRFRDIIEINGHYCSKIRGWWTVKGLSQAGPFIRYVIKVPEKNKLFVFEGFVYKPNLNTKERDLRLIESIAQTIQ